MKNVQMWWMIRVSLSVVGFLVSMFVIVDMTVKHKLSIWWCGGLLIIAWVVLVYLLIWWFYVARESAYRKRTKRELEDIAAGRRPYDR